MVDKLYVGSTREQPGFAGDLDEMVFHRRGLFAREIARRATRGYPTNAQATVSSPVIRRQDGQPWGCVGYEADVPAEASVSLDVIDPAGHVLAAGLAQGQSIESVEADEIRLRAVLSTTDRHTAPTLKSWSVIRAVTRPSTVE